MFRTVPAGVDACSHFPRVSGDVPPWREAVQDAAIFSPRERGCSDARVGER